MNNSAFDTSEHPLSVRRRRSHLNVEATKVQQEWEAKQQASSMQVYGPFSPTSGVPSTAGKVRREEGDKAMLRKKTGMPKYRKSIWQILGCFGKAAPVVEALDSEGEDDISSADTPASATTMKALGRFDEMHVQPTESMKPLKRSEELSPIEHLKFAQADETAASYLSAPEKYQHISPHIDTIERVFSNILDDLLSEQWERREKALLLAKLTVEAEEEALATTVLHPSTSVSKMDVFVATCTIVNHVLGHGEQVMNLMMLAFDVFFSALEFATSDRAGTDFSANEECRLILGNLAETIVRRLGENNRHMFKQSGKALVFLSRQGKPLQGRRWVAKAILKPVPNVHELSQNRQATLAVRARLNILEKSLLAEIGFTTPESSVDGFEIADLIHQLLLPAFQANDEKGYEYAIRTCKRSFEIKGKPFYLQLKDHGVPRPALDKIKNRIKGNKSKNQQTVDQQHRDVTQEAATAEQQNKDSMPEAATVSNSAEVDSSKIIAGPSPANALVHLPTNEEPKVDASDVVNPATPSSTTPSANSLPSLNGQSFAATPTSGDSSSSKKTKKKKKKRKKKKSSNKVEENGGSARRSENDTNPGMSRSKSSTALLGVDRIENENIPETGTLKPLKPLKGLQPLKGVKLNSPYGLPNAGALIGVESVAKQPPLGASLRSKPVLGMPGNSVGKLVSL
jgi:hypothetical protein